MIIDGHKICCKCRKLKHEDEFHRRQRGDGRQGMCRGCCKEYQRAHAAGEGGRHLAMSPQIRASVREYQKEWRRQVLLGKHLPKCRGTRAGSPLEALAYNLWQSHKAHSAIQSGKAKRLCSPEDVVALWELQEGKDAYTGVPLRLDAPVGDPERISLDRIDPAKDFTPDNICLCCSWVNRAKWSHSPGRFRRLMSDLRDFWGKFS